MSIADPYVSAGRAPVFQLRVMGGRHAELRNPYLAYGGQIIDRTLVQSAAPNRASLSLDQPKSRPRMYAAGPIHKTYPTYLYLASAFVLIGTIASGLLGYFLPGPITGTALPIFITLWWFLYRIIQQHDERRAV